MWHKAHYKLSKHVDQTSLNHLIETNQEYEGIWHRYLQATRRLDKLRGEKREKDSYLPY